MTERLTEHQQEYNIRHEALPPLVKSYLKVTEALKKPNIRLGVVAELKNMQVLLFKQLIPKEIKVMGEFITWRDRQKKGGI